MHIPSIKAISIETRGSRLPLITHMRFLHKGPDGYVFLRIQFILAILVDGRSVIISTNLFRILTTNFTEGFLKSLLSQLATPLAAMILTDQISFS